MNLQKSKLILLAVLCLFTSCFHKSNKTGSTDDVTQFFLCKTSSGTYAITHEEIFHATSKSYNGGITQITGYNDYRITVRDVATGKQVTRFIAGDRNEDILILGFDGKFLWCYEGTKDGGIQARDPVTFQITISRQKIEEANPALAKTLSTPKAYEANQYYGFDLLKQEVIVSDLKGVFYAVNVASLKARELNERPKEFPDVNSIMSTSAYVAPERYLRMEGDLRMRLKKDAITSKESFLHGAILIEQDGMHLSAVTNGYQNLFNSERNNLRKKRDSLLSTNPFLQKNSGWSGKWEEREISHRYQEMLRKLDNMKRDSANGHYQLRSFLSNQLLGCDSDAIYIAHANNVSDSSILMISKINVNGNSMTTVWTTTVTGIFYDPDKGIKLNPMKKVFSSGDPSFRFEQYALEGNTLVGIKMLFAFGIDTRTGKIIWKEQL